MKGLLFLALITIILIATINTGCSKTDKPITNPIDSTIDTTHHTIIDSGCGCNTDSISQYVSYNNFSIYYYNEFLAFNPYGTKPGWFVGVNQMRDSVHIDWRYFGKICNPDLPAIKAFTDTSSLNYGIPIRFAGKIKKLCNSESQSFGLSGIPETFYFYITIDSLIKK